MNVKTSFLKNKIHENSPNKNIVPVTTTINNDNNLFIGGCSLEDLVRKYDSPLYVLDEITLRNSCRAYKKALVKYYPGPSLPIYASKANSSLVDFHNLFDEIFVLLKNNLFELHQLLFEQHKFQLFSFLRILQLLWYHFY